MTAEVALQQGNANESHERPMLLKLLILTVPLVYAIVSPQGKRWIRYDFSEQ